MNASPIQNLPNIDSDDNQWILWRDLLDRYGKVQANLLFLEAWKTRTPDGTWLNASKANTVRLRKYLEEKGITLEKGVLDYAATYMDNVEDFFSTAFKIGKWTGISILVVVLLVIAAILFIIIRNPKVVTEAATAYATGGVSLLK